MEISVLTGLLSLISETTVSTDEITVKSLIEAHALINAHPPISTLKMAIFWTIQGKTKASIKRPLEKMEKKRTYLTLLASEFVALSPNEQVFFSLEVQINDKYGTRNLFQLSISM